MHTLKHVDKYNLPGNLILNERYFKDRLYQTKNEIKKDLIIKWNKNGIKQYDDEN